MKTHYWLVAVFCAGLTGCAATPMKVAQSQTIADAPGDKSQVVFLRSTFVGSAISASVFEVSGDELEFIGIIENKNKLVHLSEPGHRVYMVVSEAADFMEADLLPGKTYYSVVTPRMGAWKARFSLWPIRNDGTTEFNTSSEEFREWMQGTSLVVNSPESHQWFEANRTSIQAKQAKYWPVWKTKTPEDLAERTLNPDDGR